MTTRKMFWYKFNIHDYQRDTSHLSILEHGAYRLLIDQCYLSGGSLPLDLEAIYRLARAMTKQEQATIRGVLGLFFTKTDEGYRNGRISREVDALSLAGSKSRSNGAKGGRPPNSLSGSDSEVENEPENNLAGFEKETCQVSESEPRNNLRKEKGERSKDNLTLPSKAHERAGSFPIRSEWQPSPTFWAMAKHVGLDEATSDYGPALADFLGFWRDRPGESRTQAGWEKSFLESWKRYRAHSPPADKAGRKRTTGLSPHNDFEKRDYSSGINADGSF